MLCGLSTYIHALLESVYFFYIEKLIEFYYLMKANSKWNRLD